MISFAIEYTGDQKFEGYGTVKVTKANRTIRELAASRGQLPYAWKIARINNVRSIDKDLKIGRYLKVPDKLRAKNSFNVLAGDSAPTIVSGYANFETLARPERTGISQFTGYEPIRISMPLRFETSLHGEEWSGGTSPGGSYYFVDGSGIETNIAKLEAFAGRGNFPGAAVGPPPVLRVSVLSAEGTVVPLLPAAYQWNKDNRENAPLYWISSIDWDTDPIRNYAGERIRQLCTVELTQFVRPRIASAATRKKNQGDPGGGKPKDKVGLREDHRNILWVGDSLGVGTVGPARDKIVNPIQADNSTSRSGRATLTKLNSLLKSSHGLVVFDAGTNDFPTTVSAMSDLVSDVLTAVGTSRDLVIATYNAPGSTNVTNINSMLRDFARQRQRVFLVEWAQASHKENLLAADNVHATSAGYTRRAVLFKQKIEQSKT